jgi:hypothetical protein
MNDGFLPRARTREATAAKASALSDTELDELARACARVPTNKYPLHFVQLMVTEILAKTAPDLAASLRRYGRCQFQALLELIKAR